MRFILLYLKRNIQKRTANNIILFISFMMSGLLISSSLMYSQSGARGNLNLSQMPFDYMLTLDGGKADIYDNIEKIPSVGVDLITSGVNLYTIYKDVLPTLDKTAKHTRILMIYLNSSCELASYFSDMGCDITKLSYDEIYISKYLYYYFADFIKNDTIVFPDLTDEYGNQLKLKIRGVYYSEDPVNKEIFAVSSNNRLVNYFQEQTNLYNDIYFCSLTDKSNDAVNIGVQIYKTVKENYNSDFNLAYNTKKLDSAVIASGDIFIVLIGLCFSGLCIFAAMKLKTDSEYEDYRKISSLGMSPAGIVVLYFIDYLIVGACAFFAAFGCASQLFPIMIKNRGASYGQYTNFLTFDYEYKPAVLVLSALSFFCILMLSALFLLIRLLGERKTYSGFVKKSSAAYINGKTFIFDYNILNIRRNKMYTCLFVFLVCFPLFICGIYITSAQGSSIYPSGGIYSDADYCIAVPAESFNDNSFAGFIADVENINLIDTVYRVYCSGGTDSENAYYTENNQDEIMFFELNDFARNKLKDYLAEGNLDDVLNNDYFAAITDNEYDAQNPKYHIGDKINVFSEETGSIELTIGAILRNYPYDDNIAEFYINGNTFLRANSYGERLYLYLKNDVSDYSAADEQLNKAVIDPRITITNQAGERMLFQNNGITYYRIAVMMSFLICVISVFSLFLFHTQKLLNRRDEFIILKRIGYSTADIVKLNTAGAAIPFATGILVFAALYIYYIYDIYSKIAELNLYQYDKFSISYIGILIIVVTMIITLAASVFLSVKGIEDESGAKQFRERNAG